MRLAIFTFSLVHDGDRVAIAFLPGDAGPKVNHPFRIRNCRIFEVMQRGERAPLVLVQAWDSVDPLEVYVDTQWSGPDLTRFVDESIDGIDDLHRKTLFYSGLGSPPVRTVGGGVSIHSMLAGQPQKKTIQQFMDFQLGLPPPMRSGRRKVRTHLGEARRGIQMQLTSAMPVSAHRFEPLSAAGNSAFARRVHDARNKPGEHSLYGLIPQSAGTARGVVAGVVQGALRADALAPEDIDLALASMDVSLYLRDMDDYFWGTIARLHTKPIRYDYNSRWLGDAVSHVRNSLVIGLELQGLETTHADALVRALRPATRDSIARLAHAVARSLDAQIIDEPHVLAARRQLSSAVSRLLERPEVRKAILEVFTKSRPSDRYMVVLNAIADNPDADANQLYALVEHEEDSTGRRLFKDAGDLLDLLSWGVREGHWLRHNGLYSLD